MQMAPFWQPPAAQHGIISHRAVTPEGNPPWHPTLGPQTGSPRPRRHHLGIRQSAAPTQITTLRTREPYPRDWASDVVFGLVRGSLGCGRADQEPGLTMMCAATGIEDLPPPEP
jgi:hypothetical protein